MLYKPFKVEGGFTLVELLVTIAILGVLFGVVTLALSGVGSDAKSTVTIAECGGVQAAADIYLASDTSNTITARESALVDVIASGDVEFEVYLRNLPTEYKYYWNSAGYVTCADVP
jgi:prepilin-type N-terminal cleavage/methylation domain-containing protein